VSAREGRGNAPPPARAPSLSLTRTKRPPTPSSKTKHARKHSERELAAVKIDKGDVAVLAEQVEADAKAAERRLREHGGDLAAALRSYLLPSRPLRPRAAAAAAAAPAPAAAAAV